MSIEEKKDMIAEKLEKAVKMSYKGEFYTILSSNPDEEKIELEYEDRDTCWITFDDVIKGKWKFYMLVEMKG